MSQEKLNVEDLDQAVETVVAKAKKEVTQEEIDALVAAGEKLVGLGIVSENLAKFIPLLAVWHDKDAAAPVKEAVIEAFGSVEELKNYATSDMGAEIEELKGIDKALSKLNLMKAFYARRNGNATGEKKSRSKKTQQISIEGVFYDVNQVFFQGLDAEMSREDKVKAILEHPQTKKSEVVDAL